MLATIGGCLVRVLAFGVSNGGEGQQTNPYIGSLLDDCSLVSKEPMYGFFCPNPGRVVLFASLLAL